MMMMMMKNNNNNNTKTATIKNNSLNKKTIIPFQHVQNWKTRTKERERKMIVVSPFWNLVLLTTEFQSKTKVALDFVKRKRTYMVS